MEILLWLVPAAGVTVLTMLWAAWAGRPRREQVQRSEASTERFARAVMAEHPTAGTSRPVGPRDRSTGIAVRPSRNGGVPQGGARRSP